MSEARELLRQHWLYRRDAEVGRFPDLLAAIAAYLDWVRSLPEREEGAA